MVLSYSLSSVSGTSYTIMASISNDVCVIYINDKIAFTNRIYNIVNKKWSIFSSSENS
ncbi:glycoside hydrolase domain-containing protein [Chryseobacterium antibioticum]